MEIKTLPIEATCDLDFNFPSVSERYFTHYYFSPKTKQEKNLSDSVKQSTSESDQNSISSVNISSNLIVSDSTRNDTCIMMHSNRICIITLSPQHPIITQMKSVKMIDFNVQGQNRLSNKVTGKSKRGAQKMGPYSPLCTITCNDLSSYTILTGIKGKLIEVNERLVDNPSLLTSYPQAEGFIGIVLPTMQESKYLGNKLISAQDYVNSCNSSVK